MLALKSFDLNKGSGAPSRPGLPMPSSEQSRYKHAFDQYHILVILESYWQDLLVQGEVRGKRCGVKKLV